MEVNEANPQSFGCGHQTALMWVLYHYSIWLQRRLREVFWLTQLPVWLIAGKKCSAWMMFLNPSNLGVPSLRWNTVSGAYESCHGKFVLSQRRLSHCWLGQSLLEQIMYAEFRAGSGSASRPSNSLEVPGAGSVCLNNKPNPVWPSNSLACNFLPHYWHLVGSTLLQT